MEPGKCCWMYLILRDELVFLMKFLERCVPPREVTKYLQKTWPAGEDKEGQDGDHYSTQGNYSDLALQRILYWFWCRRACQGTECLEMHVVSGHEQLQKGTPSEAIIRLIHQAEAFMVNYTTHPSAGQDSGRHWHEEGKD